MTQNQNNRKNRIRKNMIILLSIIGLMVCIAVLFPPVRRMVVDLAGQIILHKKINYFQDWYKVLLSYAMGGICFILFFDYCILVNSGRTLVQKVKQEIRESFSEIDFRSFIKPMLLMSGVYLLGILTIIRANFLYMDDLAYSISGYREWYNWSRYVIVFLSCFIQPEIRMTDISPIPQLLAVIILACSSVLLAYIVGNKKITIVRLLASLPLGLSPYFLECLSYKYLAPYMAFSILTCIVPFLFITRKRAFLFVSIVCLLVMCMTYQAASGIYLVIFIILCFQNWNKREKSYKEILSFFGIAVFAFCFATLLYRFFFMRPHVDSYTSTTMLPLPHIITGMLSNIKNYALVINHDLGMIWKIGIVLVLFFFIIQSTSQSAQKKLLSFFVSVPVIIISFIVSYGVYFLLITPLYKPRALFGFGVFLAVLCIYVVSDYKKIAIVAVLALNWCLFIFAFSYGNALADQSRYAGFRISILLHDLSSLYPNRNQDDMTFQLNNSIDYAPSIKNIAKHYPVIERLVPKRLGATDNDWDYGGYFPIHFNYTQIRMDTEDASINYNSLNLPVVLDSYYHTIQSDGSRILITLKH